MSVTQNANKIKRGLTPNYARHLCEPARIKCKSQSNNPKAYNMNPFPALFTN